MACVSILPVFPKKIENPLPTSAKICYNEIVRSRRIAGLLCFWQSFPLCRGGYQLPADNEAASAQAADSFPNECKSRYNTNRIHLLPFLYQTSLVERRLCEANILYGTGIHNRNNHSRIRYCTDGTGRFWNVYGRCTGIPHIFKNFRVFQLVFFWNG